MALTSNQLALMLERSSKIDRDYKNMSMNERYYRILYLFQRRKQEESADYIKKPLETEVNNYNKIIVSNNTTTWERISKRTHNNVIRLMSKSSL